MVQIALFDKNVLYTILNSARKYCQKWICSMQSIEPFGICQQYIWEYYWLSFKVEAEKVFNMSITKTFTLFSFNYFQLFCYTFQNLINIGLLYSNLNILIDDLFNRFLNSDSFICQDQMNIPIINIFMLKQIIIIAVLSHKQKKNLVSLEIIYKHVQDKQ